METIEDKTTLPETAEIASHWYPKAKEVADISFDLYQNIDLMKINASNYPASGKNLYNSIKMYIAKILQVDAELRIESENSQLFNKEAFFSTCRNAEEFAAKYFKNLNEDSYATVLTGIKNDIAVIENRLITQCLNKIGYLDGCGFFTSFTAIVGQNSKIFSPGEEIEINAGIGSFSKSSQPEILINGISIPLGIEGYSGYKKKVQKIPGNYSIPVEIRFYNQATGKEEKRIVNINYTVAMLSTNY